MTDKQKIKKLTSALKVIRTWASFEDGVLFDTEDVVKLCDKALEDKSE